MDHGAATSRSRESHKQLVTADKDLPTPPGRKAYEEELKRLTHLIEEKEKLTVSSLSIY